MDALRLDVSADSSPYCLLLVVALVIVVSLWLGDVRKFELCMLLMLWGALAGCPS
jgi:hypothetical protein